MDPQNPSTTENGSAVLTEYYSVPPVLGVNPTSTPSSDVAQSEIIVTPAPETRTPRATLRTDANGSPYLVDDQGDRIAMTIQLPSALAPSRVGSSSSIHDAGHLGTANARLVATTAIVAEKQAATEDMHDAIQATRADVISRVDSLKDEVNSQRARLNRCLDNNLRLLRDTGASNARINTILHTMSRNGGTHRVDRLPTASVGPVSQAQSPRIIPEPIQSMVDNAIPPRGNNESAAEFDRRAGAVLHNREHAHAAFPLPKPTPNPMFEGESVSGAPLREGLKPRFESLNASTSSGQIVPRRGHDPLEGPRYRAQASLHSNLNAAASSGDRRVHLDQAKYKAAASLSTMRRGPMESASSARGVTFATQDRVNEFAVEVEDLIWATIEHRIGERIELPPGTRTPKVDNPARFKSRDDHEYFMYFLEKLLAWMRAGCFTGPELDGYRIILLQNYLDEDAHRWYVTEMDNPRISSERPLEFADVICALHRRYIKSSTAQRATREFESVVWDASIGPEGLYSALITRGQRMVEMPSQFVLKSRFMKALPAWLSRELKMRRYVTVEFTPLEVVRDLARDVWETDAGIHEEEAAIRATGNTGPEHRAAPTRPTFSNAKPGRAPDYAPKNDSRPGPRELQANPRNNRADNTPPHEKRTLNTCGPKSKGCYSCGGTDHFARDKSCPKYSEYIPRDRARVAAFRVLESYSDKESDGYDSEKSQSEDQDADLNIAPDLDALISTSNEEDMRMNAMRGTSEASYSSSRSHRAPLVLNYYSMRIVTDEEESTYGNSEVDTSITESSIMSNSPPASPATTAVASDEEAMEGHSEPSVRAESPVLFGSYNPGPICIVCNTCALVSRQVPATPENGLPHDQEYTVCEHLAGIGLRPDLVILPSSPRITTVPLPPDSEVPSEFEGIPLNWLGEPDLDPGRLIDIEAPQWATSAEAEVIDFDRALQQGGQVTLTALEFHTNVVWARRYRAYPRRVDDEEEQASRDREAHDIARRDPIRGSSVRARDALRAEVAAIADEVRINNRGPESGFMFRLDESQQALTESLGPRARIHAISMERRDRLAQAVVTQRLLRASSIRMSAFGPEMEARISSGTYDLWNHARALAIALQGRLSWSLALLMNQTDGLNLERRDEISRLHPRQATALTSATGTVWPGQFGVSHLPTVAPQLPMVELVEGQENLGCLPLDEARLWREVTPMTADDINQLANTATDLGASQPSSEGDSERAVAATPSGDFESWAEEYDRNNPGGLTWQEQLNQISAGASARQPRAWAWPHEGRHGAEFRAGRIEITPTEGRPITPPDAGDNLPNLVLTTR
ncbi:hypothetical protein DFH09DRAFT_1080352 [Mycena vulgaris]|nr:hypothetical protein DFH09DRAFT_1080352 [Mycena vulgaris]